MSTTQSSLSQRWWLALLGVTAIAFVLIAPEFEWQTLGLHQAAIYAIWLIASMIALMLTRRFATAGQGSTSKGYFLYFLWIALALTVCLLIAAKLWWHYHYHETLTAAHLAHIAAVGVRLCVIYFCYSSLTEGYKKQKAIG